MEKTLARYLRHVEKTTRERLLDEGLELLGQSGFRAWSARRVEDAAGVPHGSVRHHFVDQRGLVTAMVHRLVELDGPRDGEQPADQIRRWLGDDLSRTRARYELIVASMHDDDLAAEMVRGRDAFVASIVAVGLPETEARELVAALDGHVLDAVLRGRDPAAAAAETGRIIGRFSMP